MALSRRTRSCMAAATMSPGICFSRNRDEDLLKLIMEKYKALERECDLIVCAGSDFAGPAAYPGI